MIEVIELIGGKFECPRRTILLLDKVRFISEYKGADITKITFVDGSHLFAQGNLDEIAELFKRAIETREGERK